MTRYKYYLPLDGGFATSCKEAYDECKKMGFNMPTFNKFKTDINNTNEYIFNSLSKVNIEPNNNPTYFQFKV
jgi:hypothetical protein